MLSAPAKGGPVIVGEDEKWELVREDGMWRVFLNWAGAALVRFEAATMAGLPWESSRPSSRWYARRQGETLQTFYRVKNLGHGSCRLSPERRSRPSSFHHGAAAGRRRNTWATE